MTRSISFLFVVLLLAVATAAGAGDRAVIVSGGGDVLHGGAMGADSGTNSGAKAAAKDSVVLIGPWGSGAVVNGQFQTQGGDPSWEGWTTEDRTQRTSSAWHVDTYRVVAGARSAWCGSLAYASCGGSDPAGGYGNSYYELLVWRATVSNPALPATVGVTATVNHDVEPGYDYCSLGYYKAGDSIAYLWSTDGAGTQVPVAGSVTYQPGEYVGPAGDQIRLAWLVTSDSAYSDADCLAPSAGALQLDDVTVSLDHDGDYSETFDDFEDGTLGHWAVEYQDGVGDYCHLMSQLSDEDPCASNYSVQACFIADQWWNQATGLPTQFCQNWCYGPGGYIVTTQGGAAGPDFHINNALYSPVIDWPAGYAGASFQFDAYVHEDLSHDSPGIFYFWGIRSAAAGQDIQDAGFLSRDYLYYGGPAYERGGDTDLSDLLVNEPAQVQVWFRVEELGYYWGWDGDDGTPAPYFDNVRLVAFPVEGPNLSARAADLAQDAFPADGMLHLEGDLGLNDVRFDMARNVSPRSNLRNDPGDSVVATITAGRDGASLVVSDIDAAVTAPRLYFVVQANPVFGPELRLGVGPFSTDGDGLQQNGRVTYYADDLIEGYVEGLAAGADRWSFDLPDFDFLYPGDVLHYYFQAWDELGGMYRVATLPADLTGLYDFSDPQAYDSDFTMRALPSLYSQHGSQVRLLLWDDSGDDDVRAAWLDALHAPDVLNADFDIYTTKAPSSALGNGLGGRAAAAQIAGYHAILYTSGTQSSFTITPPNYAFDPGDDVGVLHSWLQMGDKGLFVSGDNVASDLWQSGSAGQALASDWMGLTSAAPEARALLGGQVVPTVLPLVGNGVFDPDEPWVAYGGCPDLNRIDAVTVAAGDRLAEFLEGDSGLSAASRHVAANGSVVISLPYDLSFVRPTESGFGWSLYTVLHDVLCALGFCPVGATGDAPAAFSAGAYPNPFNPSTRIEYNLPRASHLRVKVFDVSGRLVATLIDERVAAGAGHVIWDGRDAAGKTAASGVYFYELRTDQATQIDKLMLIK